MNANDFLKKICPFGEIDEVTAQEIVTFAELKLEEAEKIKGQITCALSNIGAFAFQNPKAYDKLEAKYKSKKSLDDKKRVAILRQMRREWCEKN